MIRCIFIKSIFLHIASLFLLFLPVQRDKLAADKASG